MELAAPEEYSALRRKGEREGLNLLHKLAGTTWALFGHSYPSLKVNDSLNLFQTSLALYEDHLFHDLESPNCLPYQALLKGAYMKKKHWVYASYMATLSTLPLLYKLQDMTNLTEAVLAKTAIGTSTKLLDNLNDSVQSVDEAVVSLNCFQDALIDPSFEVPQIADESSIVPLAVNSALVMGMWVPRLLIGCDAPYTRREYESDAKKLIQGQVDSITHRSLKSRRMPTIEEYLAAISEKSIGDIWLDVDLCFMEDGLNHLDQEIIRGLNVLREGYRSIFKSSLIYDDAQDLYQDISEDAINSSVLLALRAGVIDIGDIDKSNPENTVEKLDRYGITTDAIYLADLLFIKGVRRIEDAKLYMPDVIDWKALMFSFRFIRLFNLRKILLRRKDSETLALFIASLRSFDKIYEQIPERILSLERYLR